MIYAVRFDTGGKVRNLPLKYLAYAEPSPVQLSVGARVSKISFSSSKEIDI